MSPTTVRVLVESVTPFTCRECKKLNRGIKLVKCNLYSRRKKLLQRCQEMLKCADCLTDIRETVVRENSVKGKYYPDFIKCVKALEATKEESQKLTTCLEEHKVLIYYASATHYYDSKSTFTNTRVNCGICNDKLINNYFGTPGATTSAQGVEFSKIEISQTAIISDIKENPGFNATQLNQIAIIGNVPPTNHHVSQKTIVTDSPPSNQANFHDSDLIIDVPDSPPTNHKDN